MKIFSRSFGRSDLGRGTEFLRTCAKPRARLSRPRRNCRDSEPRPPPPGLVLQALGVELDLDEYDVAGCTLDVFFEGSLVFIELDSVDDCVPGQLGQEAADSVPEPVAISNNGFSPPGKLLSPDFDTDVGGLA